MRTMKLMGEFLVPLATITAFVTAAGVAIALMMAPSPRPTQRVVVPAAVTRPVAQRPAPLQIL